MKGPDERLRLLPLQQITLEGNHALSISAPKLRFESEVEVASYVLLNNGVVRDGRLAQLVRAPALQAGGRRFEPCTAHHSVSFTHRGDVVQLVRTLPPSPKSSKKALVVLVSAH
jgi:hypothetical protein